MPAYYKLLRRNLTHHGFTYTVGLNELKEPFIPDPYCPIGGLFFSREEDILRWFPLYNDIAWIAPVTLCEKSRVSHGELKLKTDRFILGPLIPIAKFINWNPLHAVSMCGLTLRYIENQTPEICLAAVRYNGCLLEFVKEQTREICMTAVHKDPYALQFVKNQTDAICMVAVCRNGYTLRYVRKQTYELCEAAVHQTWMALRWVKEQTPELCLIAVRQCWQAIADVNVQTPRLCEEALRQSEGARDIICIRI
jgi:hypothetical protein